LINKKQSLWIVTGIYLATVLAGGLLTYYLEDNSDLLAKLFFIDIALTLIVFLFSFKFGNASIYDPYWSVIPFTILFYWYFYSDIGFFTPQVLLTVLVVSLWSWRLTYNWVRRWQGLQDEDWRYINLKQQTGRWYVLVNFLGIHLFPTLIVFMAAIPLQYLLLYSHPFTLINYLGVIISFFGIWLEWLADYQLHKFKHKKQNPIAVMRFGIWRYMRHPNYLGEILFWIGLAVMAISPFTNWSLFLGAALMLLMFVFISIPMMQKRMLTTKPGYEDYIKSTYTILPKFW